MYRICIMVLKCLGLIWQFWNQILHWIWGNIIVQLQNDIDNYLFSIYLTKWDKDVNEYEVSHLTPFWICSISAQYGFKIHVRTSLLTKLSKRTTKIDPKCKESSLCYPNFRAGFGVDTKCLQNRPIWPPFTVLHWPLSESTSRNFFVAYHYITLLHCPYYINNTYSAKVSLWKYIDLTRLVIRHKDKRVWSSQNQKYIQPTLLFSYSARHDFPHEIWNWNPAISYASKPVNNIHKIGRRYMHNQPMSPRIAQKLG